MASRPTVPLFPAAVAEGIGPLTATCPACGELHPLVLLCGEQVIKRDGETLLVACSRRPNVRHGRPITCTGSTHRPGGANAVCSCECHGGSDGR